MLDTVMALPPRFASLKLALKSYLVSGAPLIKIASAHSYSAAGLVYWVRKLGLTRRKRGRGFLLAPTEEHKRVIALVGQCGVAEAARRGGVSKQRAWQIISRWAPELKGRRMRPKLLPPLRPKRGPARKVVVSFRLLPDEWQLLLGAPSPSGQLNLSASKKARAILLDHLASCGNKQNHHQPEAVPVREPSSIESVNVYNSTIT